MNCLSHTAKTNVLARSFRVWNTIARRRDTARSVLFKSKELERERQKGDKGRTPCLGGIRFDRSLLWKLLWLQLVSVCVVCVCISFTFNRDLIWVSIFGISHVAISERNIDDAKRSYVKVPEGIGLSSNLNLGEWIKDTPGLGSEEERRRVGGCEALGHKRVKMKTRL